MSFRLPEYRLVNEVVVRDTLHVVGAHNSVSQSRLMERGLRIVPVNRFGIKIYHTAPAMWISCGGQGNRVAKATQVGGFFWVDVDAGGKGGRSRDVSRGRKRYTSPKTIPKEHTYADFLEPVGPKPWEILVRIASTPTINRPLPAADGNSKGSNPGGNSNGGNSGNSSAGKMKDHMGSSDETDENESEDEDDPPVVIDKCK